MAGGERKRGVIELKGRCVTWTHQTSSEKILHPANLHGCHFTPTANNNKVLDPDNKWPGNN